MNSRAKFLETTTEQKERISKVREMFSEVYDTLDKLCESSRETSLAFTKLEEAQFLAIKGITREQKEGK